MKFLDCFYGEHMIPEHKKLNLGCGFRKIDDHWNVDRDPNCNPNEVLDLEQCPWPYEDNFFDRITIDNVINYLGKDADDFEKILQEMYRVSAPNAEWYIRTPHPRADHALDDYRQRRLVTPKTLMFMDQKLNFESVAKKTGDPVLGFELAIDLEIKDVNPLVNQYWHQQIKEEMIGQRELQIKSYQMNNVLDGYGIFITVHKPQRFQDWFKTQKKK
jgi:SAM-dependent methyltransferase